MSQKSYIKCLECDTLNLNSDYCTNCGSIININLKRTLEREKRIQKDLEQKMAEKPNKIDEFLKNAAEHPNALVRFFVSIIYSVWLFLAMVVGGLIASIIAVAAG